MIFTFLMRDHVTREDFGPYNHADEAMHAFEQTFEYYPSWPVGIRPDDDDGDNYVGPTFLEYDGED